jgi:ABC-type lipoprotein export system ATPase subunit
MDTPTEGEIWLDTVNLPQLGDAQLTRIRRERIGFVFQFFNLLSTLTVAENVAVPLELNPERPLQDHQRQERVGQLLETVHLGHRASFFPATLSGGEMQRVAIARALATDPDVILADEPTGNLDSENGLAVLQLLQRISRERGKTILMATHSEEAAQFAHRIIRMRDGQILSDQPVPSAGS